MCVCGYMCVCVCVHVCVGVGVGICVCVCVHVCGWVWVWVWVRVWGWVWGRVRVWVWGWVIVWVWAWVGGWVVGVGVVGALGPHGCGWGGGEMGWGGRCPCIGGLLFVLTCGCKDSKPVFCCFPTTEDTAAAQAGVLRRCRCLLPRRWR